MTTCYMESCYLPAYDAVAGACNQQQRYLPRTRRFVDTLVPNIARRRDGTDRADGAARSGFSGSRKIAVKKALALGSDHQPDPIQNKPLVTSSALYEPT